MAVGNRSFTGPTSQWQLHRGPGDPLYGTRPAGPVSAAGTIAQLSGPRSLLPSAGALDYAHKLTTTTVLLLGLAALLLFGPPTPRAKLRALANRVRV